MTDDMTILDRAGPDPTDWKLARRDGELEARRAIPHDGVRVYSTESRAFVSYRKSSRYNLDATEVLDLYRDRTGRDVGVPTTVREAVLERLRGVDGPVDHGDLVFQVEYTDGFDMDAVEATIDDLAAADRIRDAGDAAAGPAWEVA
jgi:hypothetical protein